ncbi:MAG: c-type cytochrome [Bdellovibrionales bacterium]|nr:c-type cytochrome [Bdellovibrionales bacterium]
MRKVKISLLIGFLSCLLVLFENCSMVGRPQDYGSGSDASLTLQKEAMKVMNARCVSCHNPQMPSGGIDYLTNQDSLLYYRLVVPGEPQLSYLYTVISNGQMPPAPTSLSAGEIKAVYDWIQDGFKDPGSIGITPPPPGVLEPKFASINRMILQTDCLGCHNSANPSGGVSFSTYASTMNTVQAGNVNASALYQSVIPTGTMPKGGAKLSASEVSAIQTWIQNGALNN